MLLREELTERIIGAAIAVHRELGPGLLESAYAECLAAEMASRGLAFVRELRLPVYYRGQELAASYRMDFLVEDTVIVELKSVDRIEPVHRAQLLSYLRLSNKPVGLLLNFNVATLKSGIIRMISTHPHQPPILREPP